MVEPNDTSGTSIRLGDFQPTADRGASRPIEAMWYLVKMMFFLTSFRWPSPAKSWLLRVFGAEVGSGVVIAPRVDIHMPWKLQIGDHSWIGTDVMLLNLEPITIGSNTCVSQRAFLCTGGHDYTSPTFDYRGGDIVVGDGVWIGGQSFVGPGVTIGTDTVIAAGSVALSPLPSGQICGGNPCVPIKPRVVRDAER